MNSIKSRTLFTRASATTSKLTKALLTCAAVITVVGLTQGTTSASAQEKLKSYKSDTKDFWANPPDDWFLGDETEAQKGQAPPAGPPTGSSDAELAAMMKKIKLPPGFKIEVYASGVLAARQMAWGANGTLFVGSIGLGNVYAITDKGGKKDVKTIIKGLKMPTDVAVQGDSLYVVDINKLMKYENAEANLDKMPEAKVVYDDMPSYLAHGWKYLAADKDGWFYIPLGPPFNIGIPPTSVSQIRRVDPKTGNAEVYALGVRNSVGGDVDPRTGKYWFTENARDWVSNDLPSDKLNMISKLGEHFGYPYCHQGDLPDPKFAMGHTCSEFTPPVVNLGAHVAPLGMKFYTGDMFPAEYKNNILIAEHGSWNRNKYQGALIKRVTVDPDGKNPKQEVFASGWIEGDTGYLGRPADVIQAKDGSILIADDWAGAIYRISYAK
jgi:glucose/arabinose dehydrogenase